MPVVLLKNTPTQLFSRKICEIFQNIFFMKHLRVTASAYQVLCILNSFDNCNYLKNIKFKINSENKKTLKI